jgi:hypothetical protein
MENMVYFPCYNMYVKYRVLKRRKSRHGTPETGKFKRMRKKKGPKKNLKGLVYGAEDMVKTLPERISNEKLCLQMALSHQLHSAQYCLLGSLWRP